MHVVRQKHRNVLQAHHLFLLLKYLFSFKKTVEIIKNLHKGGFSTLFLFHFSLVLVLDLHL